MLVRGSTQSILIQVFVLLAMLTLSVEQSFAKSKKPQLAIVLSANSLLPNGKSLMCQRIGSTIDAGIMKRDKFVSLKGKPKKRSPARKKIYRQTLDSCKIVFSNYDCLTLKLRCPVIGGGSSSASSSNPSSGASSSQNSSIPTIKSCEDYKDQFSCNEDGAQIASGRCHWFRDSGSCRLLPQSCQQVYYDENKNLVVDGKKFFPIGFWSSYNALPDNYKDHFNVLVHDWVGHLDYMDKPEVNGKVKLLAQSAVKFANNYTEIQPRTVTQFAGRKNVLGWETYPEPNNYAVYHSDTKTYSYVDARGDVRLQSRVVSESDPCGLPQILTPTVSGAVSNYAIDHNSFIDGLGVQGGYRAPEMDVTAVGSIMEVASGNVDPHPAFFVTSIEGFQSNRYRITSASPSPEIILMQSIFAINHGAKGVLFYNLSKGVGDRQSYEPFDANFDLLEDSSFYQAIQGIADRLTSLQSTFFSPKSTTVQVSSPDDIDCGVWQISSTKLQLTCANIAHSDSSFFKYNSGGETIRIHAQLKNASSGKLMPGYECSDGIDNDRDGATDDGDDSGCSGSSDDNESAQGDIYTLSDLKMDSSRMQITDVSLPLPSQYGQSFDKVQLYVKSIENDPSSGLAPLVSIALYSDSHRDGGAGTKVAEASSLSIPFSGPGYYEFSFPSVTLEKTRKYYLITQVTRGAVTTLGRDVRGGLSTLSGLQNFDSSYPVLVSGIEKSQVPLTIQGTNITNCKVTYGTSSQQATCPHFGNSSITDDFSSYGVNVYELDILNNS